LRGNPVHGAPSENRVMACDRTPPRARALLPARNPMPIVCQLGALLSSPVLGVRLLTALQVLQVRSALLSFPALREPDFWSRTAFISLSLRFRTEVRGTRLLPSQTVPPPSCRPGARGGCSTPVPVRCETESDVSCLPSLPPSPSGPSLPPSSSLPPGGTLVAALSTRTASRGTSLCHRRSRSGAQVTPFLVIEVERRERIRITTRSEVHVAHSLVIEKKIPPMALCAGL